MYKKLRQQRERSLKNKLGLLPNFGMCLTAGELKKWACCQVSMLKKWLRWQIKIHPHRSRGATAANLTQMVWVLYTATQPHAKPQAVSRLWRVANDVTHLDGHIHGLWHRSGYTQEAEFHRGLVGRSQRRHSGRLIHQNLRAQMKENKPSWVWDIIICTDRYI